MKKLLAFALFIFCLLIATSGSMAQQEPVRPPVFKNAFVRATPLDVTAGYLVIYNFNNFPDYLVGAQASWADRVELHMTDTDANGVKTMKPVKKIPVPDNGHLTLRPGGLHLMIYGLKKKLAVGDVVSIELNFARMGRRSAKFAVKPISYMNSQTHQPAKSVEPLSEKPAEKPKKNSVEHSHH